MSQKKHRQKRQAEGRFVEFTLHVPSLSSTDHEATLETLHWMLAGYGVNFRVSGPEFEQRCDIIEPLRDTVSFERAQLAARDFAALLEPIWWQAYGLPAKPFALLAALAPVIGSLQTVAESEAEDWDALQGEVEKHGIVESAGFKQMVEAYHQHGVDVGVGEFRTATSVVYSWLDQLWWHLYETSDLFTPAGSAA